MQNGNRIKTEASIDVDGAIVFGSAVEGYASPETYSNDTIPYLLTKGSDFEFGHYVLTDDGTTITATREVSMASVAVTTHPDGGFDNETTGLTFHGVIVATQLLACNSQEVAKAAGAESCAGGPNTQAFHDSSSAFGVRMQTTMPGESASGLGVDGSGVGAWVSTVAVLGTVAASDSGSLVLRADDTTNFALGLSAWGTRLGVGYSGSKLKGYIRVSGTIVVIADSGDQVHDVSCILYSSGSGTPDIVVAFTATPLVSGSTIDTHSLSLNGSREIVLQNDSAVDEMSVHGHLTLTRITTGATTVS